MLTLLLSAIFVSSDEVQRAKARNLRYGKVCQHPLEIGVLDSIKLLIIDFNQILFDDHELAINIANEAARRGIIVGVHTYYPETLKLQRLATLPNVLVATNHSRLLKEVDRYAKLHGRPWQKIVKVAKPLEGEVNDVHDYDEEGTVGSDANVPAGV